MGECCRLSRKFEGNEIRIEGNDVYIILKRRDDSNLETVIDLDEYLEKISKMRVTWIAQYRSHTNSYYVQGHPYMGTCDGTADYDNIYLHRVIKETPAGMVTDHRDHDTLNNRKSNLFNVTYSENSLNRKGANKNNRTGEKNITFVSEREGYRVQKSVSGKNRNFGIYKTLSEAIEVRDTISRMTNEERIRFIENKRKINIK